MSIMTPREIVHELDKHIIGQQQAKRAVAIALPQNDLTDARRDALLPLLAEAVKRMERALTGF